MKTSLIDVALMLGEDPPRRHADAADFHKTLKRLREKYPNQASLSYIHLPLAMHRFAMPAARVAECAGEQGGFESMHDYLFEAQDSLGLKPWSEYATRAGVPDLKAFETCIASTAAVPRIEAGKALGERLGINATPTLIINGWKLARPPTGEELDAMINSVLSGRSPVYEKGS